MISIVTSSSPRARCKPGRENFWNPMAMWSATTLNVQQVPEAFVSHYQTFWMKMFTAVGPHSSEIFSQQKISHTVKNICGPHYIGAGLKYVGAFKILYSLALTTRCALFCFQQSEVKSVISFGGITRNLALCVLYLVGVALIMRMVHFG